jgi:hypothetical protein
MNMVGIVSRESGETLWVNPDQVTYVESSIDGTGGYSIIHFACDEVLPVEGDPEEVARSLTGDYKQRSEYPPLAGH